MQESPKHLLKHHMASSLIIAVGLHLLVLFSYYSFSERNPYLTTFDPNRVFPVQFSSDVGENSFPANESSRESPAAPIKKKREIIGSLTGVTSNAANDANPKISADGTGQEVGETGTFIFENEIDTYSPPDYPKVARLRGLEGDVLLRLKVSPEGKAVAAEIIKGSGHQVLDEAALNAVKEWRFHPRKTSDIAVVEKRIVFKLNR